MWARDLRTACVPIYIKFDNYEFRHTELKLLSLFRLSFSIQFNLFGLEISNLLMESFDLQNVNLDLLRRKCCFVSGQKLTYENEYEDESKKKVFKSCFELGDILPI